MPGPRLSPAIFDRQLREMGQAVSWRRASACPCRDPFSGAPEQGCPNCEGRGTVWGAATPAWTGVSGMKIRRQYADFGRWEDGDVLLTVPGASPLWAAAEHDRILMLQSSEPFSAVLTRDGTERLRFPVASLDRCTWRRPGDKALVDAAPPRVAADGTLSWADPARAPDPGEQFALTGRKRPEFYVFQEMPIDRSHFGGLALPRRLAARRFDLFGR